MDIVFSIRRGRVLLLFPMMRVYPAVLLDLGMLGLITVLMLVGLLLLSAVGAGCFVICYAVTGLVIGKRNDKLLQAGLAAVLGLSLFLFFVFYLFSHFTTAGFMLFGIIVGISFYYVMLQRRIRMSISTPSIQILGAYLVFALAGIALYAGTFLIMGSWGSTLFFNW
jgi:hypothetical protein